MNKQMYIPGVRDHIVWTFNNPTDSRRESRPPSPSPGPPLDLCMVLRSVTPFLTVQKVEGLPEIHVFQVI
jgi:hypothetical protein